jgi:shikimate kinase
MGCGKSTVAAHLSKMLTMDVIEVDELIVEKSGMSIADMFDKYGEEYFRNEESSLITELENTKKSVISCGGGVPMRENNVQSMKKNGRVVLLMASPETIYERVKNTTERPLLNHNMSIELINELFEKRREKYEAAADIIVSTDNKTMQEICEDVIRQMMAIENKGAQG